MRDEIARRQSPAPSAAAPAADPANADAKVTPDDLKALVQEAKTGGVSWAQVREHCQSNFGKAEPNLLTKSELQLLKHDLLAAYPF